MNPTVPMPLRLAALVAAGLFLAGCSKVTADNYAKLKVGMTYQETTAILGNPAGCSDTAGFRSCKWGDDKASITVRFAADKAVLHSAEGIR
jgi:hypothetical protein